MKSLLEFITEMLLESENQKINKDTLLDALNNHAGSLDEFVKTLNTALKNSDKGDNAALWLGAIKDLFNGEYGEKYKAKNHVALPISKLYPTQSEIDIENSAKWATKDWGAKGVADMFKDEAFGKSFPVPVLVYGEGSKGWIIDGHHRWSQVGLINPDAKLDCLVVTGPESVQDFLKIVQGTIASVLAADNKNNGKNGDRQLPVGKANPNNNIFGNALAGNKIRERVIDMLDNIGVNKILCRTLQDVNVLSKKCTLVQQDSKGEVNESQIYSEQKFKESVATLVMKNRDLMIKNKQTPPEWAAPRPVMPQSDAAGPNNPNDPKDGNPDNEGSALYAILHKSKFPNIGK